jgi:hypothetical protein
VLLYGFVVLKVLSVEVSLLHAHEVQSHNADSDQRFVIYKLRSDAGCSGWVDPKVGLSEFDVVCTQSVVQYSCFLHVG